jgi:uncharacterized protein (TIGR02271 family)
MMSRNTVVGVFDDRDDAQRAIEALKDAGFRSEDIGITMRDRKEAEALVEDTGTHAGAGAATGAMAGGVLGGLAGWLVGIGALAIPGIGPIVAAGPIAAALTGAAVGAAGGGLIGALTGMGVPEEEARWYESEVGRGGILVTAGAEGRYDEARSIMLRHGAREAGGEDTVGTGRARGTTGTMDTDFERGRSSGVESDTDRTRGMSGSTGRGFTGGVGTMDRGVDQTETVPLREERLEARKQPVETGEVEIRKEVVSEQRTIDVPVTREEVVVERHPVERRESDRFDTGNIGSGETIRVPVREEQVSVEKKPIVTEEVSVGKRTVQDTQHVSDTVRREEAVIEGDTNVRGAGNDWSGVSSQHRSDWQSRYGTSGRTWEQDEPAYRYGWESASNPSHRNREWSDAEPELRRGWSDRYGQHGQWDQVKDHVQSAWNRSRGRR